MPKRPKHYPKLALQPVVGYVYCDKLGEIHELSLDPYGYGSPDEDEEDMRCKTQDHRLVYARQL